MSTLCRQLAEWCAEVSIEDIPAGFLKQLPLRVLDSIGLIVAASETPAVDAARRMALATGGEPQCSLVGSALRVPAQSAALVHGIAAHCFDFDDTFADSVIHPGSIVVPTALAIAEASSATNDDFYAAIAVGYEVAARLGAVAGRQFHSRNMHASGIVGPLVAAAVAARLQRRDAQHISWAFGLAASMSSGIRAYAMDGGWSKWLHLGWSAHGGIVADHLAHNGFRGPEHVLDGGQDLYSVMLFGNEVDRSLLLDGLGIKWLGAGADFKLYPCAHVIQPFIDAVLHVVTEHNLRADDILSVECALASWAAAIVCEPPAAKLRFDSELEAIGSLPYQLSVAVLDRRVSLHALAAETRNRNDIRIFAEKVRHQTSTQFKGRFDGHLTIRTNDGRVFERSTSLNNESEHQIIRKFSDLTRELIGESGVLEATAAITDIGSHHWNTCVDIINRARKSKH